MLNNQINKNKIDNHYITLGELYKEYIHLNRFRFFKRRKIKKKYISIFVNILNNTKEDDKYWDSLSEAKRQIFLGSLDALLFLACCLESLDDYDVLTFLTSILGKMTISNVNSNNENQLYT
jgi:hypothetical protein